jgi:hypothetical protein
MHQPDMSPSPILILSSYPDIHFSNGIFPSGVMYLVMGFEAFTATPVWS